MTQDAIETKIQRIVRLGANASEDEIRSLAVLIRKRLELIADRADFSTLNLFCNWAVHTALTESIPGLRTLARVNDALADAVAKEKSGARRDRYSPTREIVAATGLTTLRSELIAFIDAAGISHKFDDKDVWAAFMKHLIEIIRDTPITFPPIDELRPKARKIYEQMAQIPLRGFTGVVSITLSDIDLEGELKARGGGYDNLPKALLRKGLHLVIRTRDSGMVGLVPFVWTE